MDQVSAERIKQLRIELESILPCTGGQRCTYDSSCARSAIDRIIAWHLEQSAPIVEPENGEFIVAEVSKNWIAGDPIDWQIGKGLLAHRFEHCIAVNMARGYELHSWSHKEALTGELKDVMNETIIAVFRRSS